uniref:Minor tail protein gp31 C-terminal domain-containing protein n=1 Tax=viral metagenome TaxID=1070528 RepID=A0A6M3M1C6_9ZZZZ
MLGDVTPSQLRLIQTGAVYTGRDNKFTVLIQRYNGRKFVPADLSAVTQFVLIVPGDEPVVIDSLTYPDSFAAVGGILTLDLSDFAFTPGTYTTQLIAHDAEHPRGQVLCELYDTAMTFTVRDVSAMGSNPLPTLSYVEEAPRNGVVYGRRDGAWVLIEVDALGVSSFNGRIDGVVLLSEDVTQALGFAPVRPSDLPTLAAVATSGAYADLNGKPFIPTTAGDVGAATAAQGGLADTAVQPQTLTDQLATKVDVVAGKQLSDENYTSAEKTKLAGLEAAHYRGTYVNLTALQTAVPTGVAGDYADVDAGVGSPVLRYIWDASDSEWVVQAGNADPITAAQVKTLYESNADTNAFTDSEKTKLGGVAAGATANTSTDTLAEGATNLYYTAARVRSVVLTGLSVATNAAIAATDTVLSALGKLQAQITALGTTVSNKVDKVAGKQLSTEDYTTAEKDKLASLSPAGTWVQLTRAQYDALATKDPDTLYIVVG